IVPTARREEVACDAHHLRLLAADHRFERGAGDGAATAPHLDEDEHVAVEGDQVDLAGAAAVVPGHDRVAAGTEELLRHRLPAPPRSRTRRRATSRSPTPRRGTGASSRCPKSSNRPSNDGAPRALSP